MTSHLSKQAPAKALEQVLGLFDAEGLHNEVGNAEASWGIFTYHTSFKELWDTPVYQLPCKVAIIWGREAATEDVGEVNIASCISPIAWAVYGLKSRQDLQILILDTAPSQHRKENRLYPFIEAIQPELMPWLRLVPLSELGCFLTNSLPPLVNKETPTGNSDSRSEFLDMLSHQIQRDLTESRNEGNHHAIQNIVGPQVLLGEAEREGISFGERALLTLFRTVGLIEESKRDQAEAHSKPEKWPIRYWGENTIRLLLVDDQHQFGWTTWVESAVHQECKQRVVVTSGKKPHFLLEAVRRTLDGRLPDSGGSDAKRDGRFKLEFGNPIEDGMNAAATSGDRQTILLLDLRLFALEGNTEAEVEFLQEQLLPLCERFAEQKTSARAFAWPGFLPEELDRVQCWCMDKNRERNSPAHLIALTFLPRLIALADMSVPIVVFSSTGKREIVDRLKDYGNIITDFEKPRFVGQNAADAVFETRRKFDKAIKRALDILGARSKCADVAKLVKASATQPRHDKSVHIEVYLDEHGPIDGVLSVGGCFAVFHDADDAVRKADRFDDWLVQRKGLRHFNSHGIGPNSPNRLLAKDSNLGSRLADFRESSDAPTGIGVARLGINSRPVPDEDWHEADNLFRHLLTTFVELFLADSVRAIGDSWGHGPTEISVSIFCGSKVARITDRVKQGIAQARYGLRRHRDSRLAEDHFYSFDRHEAAPIVTRILSQRKIRDVRLERSIAVRLCYGLERKGPQEPEYFICRKCGRVVEIKKDDLKWIRQQVACWCHEPEFRPDYRGLHYVADELLRHFPRGNATQRYDGIFKQREQNQCFRVFPGEFDDLLDTRLTTSIEASRALDLNDLVTAIEKIRPSSLPTDGSKPKARYWIARRSASRLHELKGPDFVRLANRLAEQNCVEKEEGGPGS